MRINEINLDPEQSTIERLRSSTAATVETWYRELSVASSEFSVPAHSILPRDTIHELIDKLLFEIDTIKNLNTDLSQTLQIATALLQYLDA